MRFFAFPITLIIIFLVFAHESRSQIPSDNRIVLVADAGTRDDYDSWHPLPTDKPDWFRVPDEEVAQANLILSIAQAGAKGVFVVGDEPVYRSPISAGRLNRSGIIFHINSQGSLLLHGMYEMKEGKRWCPKLKVINQQTFFNVGLWAAGALGYKTTGTTGFDFIPSTRRYLVIPYQQWGQKLWWTQGGAKVFAGKFVVLGDLDVNQKEKLEWRQEKRAAEARHGMDASEGRLIKNSVLVADMIGSALWEFEKSPSKEPNVPR